MQFSLLSPLNLCVVSVIWWDSEACAEVTEPQLTGGPTSQGGVLASPPCLLVPVLPSCPLPTLPCMTAQGSGRAAPVQRVGGGRVPLRPSALAWGLSTGVRKVFLGHVPCGCRIRWLRPLFWLAAPWCLEWRLGRGLKLALDRGLKCPRNAGSSYLGYLPLSWAGAVDWWDGGVNFPTPSQVSAFSLCSGPQKWCTPLRTLPLHRPLPSKFPITVPLVASWASCILTTAICQ